MIELAAVTYSYPESARPALQVVDLNLEGGGWTLVAGPSGCGKSTLLRCLNGLVPHFHGGRFSGRVRVAGRDPVALGPRAMSRWVGFLFQHPERQFVTQRVEDEVVFAMESHAIAPPAMEESLEQVLGELGLAALRRRRLSTLSGGERQKVALASVLALRPRLLVLDEPTSQIDPESAGEIFTLLDRWRTRHGLTLVMSEHRFDRLLEVIDRVVLLEEDGRIGAQGTVREVLATGPLAPPLLALGAAHRWRPLPLDLETARRFPRPVPGAEKTGSGTQAGGDARGSELLAVHGLAAGYDRSVLTEVDLTIRPGERIALMGANGSGKSTLLKTLVGLQAPLSGEVMLEGVSHRQRSLLDTTSRIGLVPQNAARLLFRETLGAELSFSRQQRKLAPEDHRLLAALELDELVERNPRDLSGGERQRAAVAAMLAAEPRLLLLDEPTRGLDRGSKDLLISLLEGWCRGGGAVVLATHDAELVASFAERLLVLAEGRLVADGAVGEVMMRHPAFASTTIRLWQEPRHPDLAPWLPRADGPEPTSPARAAGEAP